MPQLTPTNELRTGDTVLVVPGSRRHHRASPVDTTTEWRTITVVYPQPETGWEYRRPQTSARWSIQFNDGCYAGSTRTTKWIVQTP
jgi:hypothetical protein